MIHAINGTDFSTNEGDIIILINEYGDKITLLQTLAILVPNKTSETKLRIYLIKLNQNFVYDGIAHVPEGRRFFAQLSVM